MTPSQKFKAGFLMRCADEGLSREQTEQRIKAASQFVSQLEKRGAGGTIGALASVPAKALDLLKSLGLWGVALPAAASFGGGYMAGAAFDEPADPKEVKKQELIAAYQRYADQIRRQTSRSYYRDVPPRKPQL